MSCSPPLIGTLQARAFRIAHGIARALGAYVRRYSGWGRRRILLVRNNAFSSVPNQTSSGKQHVFLAPTVGGAALAFVLINVVRNHSGSLPNIETDQPLDRSPRPYDVKDRTYAATRLIDIGHQERLAAPTIVRGTMYEPLVHPLPLVPLT